MKMNRFKANLHPAFFKKNIETPEVTEGEKVLNQAREEERKLQADVRRNNEALASSTRPVEAKEDNEQSEEKLAKELEKQLKQLAKNKKIDFPWTDNAWKCSRAEKKLAVSSAKVFQQLVENGKIQTIVEKCKSQNGELTKEDAEKRVEELKINSKAKDVLNFYKAYKEYQDPQSEFQHLKNLMGFFLESDFKDKESLQSSMGVRSEKISKQDIKNAGKFLYQEGVDKDGRHVIIDNRTGQEVENKPKDWKQRASFEVIKNRLNNKENPNTNINKMLTLLGDFNLDGEVNSGDVGYKTGSQFVDVFRRAVATNHLKDAKFDDNAAVKNIVAYANKFGMDIQNVQTVDGLYQWMTDSKKGYENTIGLQKFLRNLPVELDDVISNGAGAGKQSLDRMVSAIGLEKKEEEAAKKAAEEKAKEIVSAGEAKLKEVIKDNRERADITQQLLNQLPQMLISKAAEQQRGLAAGTSVPLDQIIKGMSAGFNVGIGPDGKPNFGLFLGWDRRFNLSDRTQLETAVTGGTKLLFVPCAAASMELSQDVNKGSRNKSLDAKGEHRITLGGNVAMTGPIFSYGFSAGYENNKQVGIEKQAQNINKVVKEQAKNRVKALSGATDKKDALKKELSKEFSKASDEDLNTATDNLLSIIQQFKIDEKSTEKDFETYAQIIADVYSEQWRNAKMAGIADNKRKISGGKVGIQFIAGCVPVASLVAKFTKYRNARTNETEHSRVARLDAQVNGRGNEVVNLGDSKEIGAEKVAQINEILKRYGAKSEVKYIAGTDGKPGKIQVPASIADGIGINVRVSESMKGYVGQMIEKRIGGETFYYFPANAIYRVLQETGGNQRSVTLNIGSDKTSSDDIMLSDITKMNTLLGSKEMTAGKKWEFSKNGVFESRGQAEYNPEFLSTLFTDDVVKGLQTIDSSDWKKFSAFMKNKRDAVSDFNNTIDSVIKVLGNDKKYETIKQKLLDEKTSYEDKQLIIDRIMAISAYTNVHDKKGLDANVKHRGNYYRKETMVGPNGKSIFGQLSVKREDLLPDVKGYDSEFKGNILGATAFYHRNNKEKGLAITGLGATNVLGGVTKELNVDDTAKAKDWFLGKEGVLNENKSPKERSNLKRGISNYIKNKVGEFKNEQLSSLLTEQQLKDLLEGKEIELALDNSQKKVKVKLDVKYVFYLMGECANESVGMELGNLQVQEQQEVDDYKQGQLWLNNSDGASSVGVSRKDAAVGIAFGGGKKKGDKPEEEPEYIDGSDPSDGQQPDSTEPEQEGNPIGDSTGNSGPSDGSTPDNPSDDVWTEGGQNGGESPDVGNWGKL